MESSLWKIVVKQSDYVVCSKCRSINWYENDLCSFRECNAKLKQHPQYSVAEWCEDEYEFWADEGYTELDADNVSYEV